MSEENLELIRAGFAAHNRGDLDALVEFYDPDVVFETLLLGTHRGNEAIRLIYEENQKTLSGYDVVPVELIDSGDQVVAVAQVTGVGPASQIAMDGARSPSSSRSRTGGSCESRPFETGTRPSKPPVCGTDATERVGMTCRNGEAGAAADLTLIGRSVKAITPGLNLAEPFACVCLVQQGGRHQTCAPKRRPKC